MPDPLDIPIRDNASGPAKAGADGVSVSQHRLRDQIEADRYLAAKDATKGKRFPLRITKIVPPGAAS